MSEPPGPTFYHDLSDYITVTVDGIVEGVDPDVTDLESSGTVSLNEKTPGATAEGLPARGFQSIASGLSVRLADGPVRVRLGIGQIRPAV